jgi:hypothetical protein
MVDSLAIVLAVYVPLLLLLLYVLLAKSLNTRIARGIGLLVFLILARAVIVLGTCDTWSGFLPAMFPF